MKNTTVPACLKMEDMVRVRIVSLLLIYSTLPYVGYVKVRETTHDFKFLQPSSTLLRDFQRLGTSNRIGQSATNDISPQGDLSFFVERPHTPPRHSEFNMRVTHKIISHSITSLTGILDEQL